MILFGVLPVDWVIGTVIAIILYYVYLTWNYDHWKKRGVQYEKPQVFIGNYKNIILGRQSVADLANEAYEKYNGIPAVGLFRFRTPMLLIRDPEMLSIVVTKEFRNFSSNAANINPEMDPLLAKNPFFLTGEKWKRTRAMLSPSFTSGKLKSLYPLMKKTADDLDTYLQKHAHASTSEGLEAKDLCAKYTTDLVARCTFGVEANTLQGDEEFFAMNKKSVTPDFSVNLRFLISMVFPQLTSILKVRLMPVDVANFYSFLVKNVINHRERNNEKRNDFLHLLMQLKEKAKTAGQQNNEPEYEFTDEDVIAHAVTFITDGFETSSTTMSFLLYQLALNLDVQERLRKELQEAEKESGEKLNVETLLALPYLNMVLAETLRMHPPAMVLEKICTNKCVLPKKDGSTIQVDPGTLILVPIHALHHDPKHFPDPHIFDPERFSDARKSSIQSHTYLPFGEGPRTCVGMRFAQFQIKVGISHVVMNYDIRPTAKTPRKIVYDVNSFLASAMDGLWLNFKRRQ